MLKRIANRLKNWPGNYFLGFIIGVPTSVLSLKLNSPIPYPISALGVWVASIGWGLITAAILSGVVFHTPSKSSDRIITLSTIAGIIVTPYAFQALRVEG